MHPPVILKKNVVSWPLKVSSAGYDFEGGLMDRETGELIEQAIILRHGKLQQTLAAKTDISVSLPEIKEIVFYGGILFDNFGHFLLESLSRLWAYQAYAKDKTPIFFYVPWGMPAYKKKNNYVYQVLKGFGIPVSRVVFFNSPVLLRTVIISEQKYGFGISRNPSTDFLSFIRSFQFKHKISRELRRYEKVYVSRSAVAFKMGRPFGELYFEKYLQQEGYLIFHPERYSVYEQLSLYKSAKQIVFCDGGATYCTILAPDLKAEIAIVARRRDHRWNYKEVTEHFYGYKKSVLWIDEVICQYQFGLETWDAAAEIDWYKVSITLKENRFSNNLFQPPDPDEYTKTKKRELLQYIQSIQTNPLFIDYMLNQKEQFPILPNSF